MGQSLYLKHKGLYTAPEEFSAIPAGAMLTADDVSVDVDDLLEPRRGQDRLIPFPSGTDRARRYAFYQDIPIAAYSNGKIARIAYKTVSSINTSTDTFTSNSHGYSNGDVVRFYATGALPSGLTYGRDYYIISSATNTFKVSLSSGGSAVDISASNTGTLYVFKKGATPAWTDYSGTYNDPDSTYARLRFLKVLSNLYFTTSLGVYRLDSPTGTPVLSGMPEGLDINLSFSSGTYLSTANQVAYRIIWGFKDANSNIYLGAPSGRAVITNSTGATQDVVVRSTVPSGLSTSYFYQVYRSAASGAATIVPGDELGLIKEAFLSSTDISNGYVEFTDSTSDSLRGATLYVSPSQEGGDQANDRPPQAEDVAFFANSMFYANTISKHRLYLTLLATGGSSGVAVDDTITIAGTTYTAKGVESIASRHYFLAKSYSTTATTNSNTTLSSVASFDGVKVGRSISGTGIPTGTTIAAFDSGASTITLSQAATASAAGVAITISGTPAQDIYDTAESLVRVINRNSTNTTVYAAYISGTDSLPGQMVIFERAIGGSSFAATVSARGSAFDPELPTSGTTVSSSNDDFKNQLFYSKSDKPEAVPLLNYLFVGSSSNAIRRIMPLGNTLFVFKEKEGIYRVTGSSPSTFSVELFDSSARLLAPDSVAVVNNQIWCLTDQGITVVTETGVSVISRPIEDQILEQTGTALAALQQYSFGVGYETDRKYFLWTVSAPTDTYCTQAFVYNTFTKAFTRWTIPATVAEVSSEDNKLYIGHGTTANTLQERKTFTYQDIVDNHFAVTIVSTSGTSITLSSSSGITVGDVLSQGTLSSLVTAVNGATMITVADSLGGWAAGGATIFVAYESVAEYAPVTGGNPGTSKQWPEAAFLWRRARFSSATVGFATDASGSFEEFSITGNRVGLWGLFPWGESPWGGTPSSVPIRVFVPLEKQRGSLLRVRFRIRQGYSNWAMNGLSIPFRELAAGFKIAK